MSYTSIAIILTLVAILFYGAIVLYGTWIDGRRQALRNKGLHPTTRDNGEVYAREDEEKEDTDGIPRG